MRGLNIFSGSRRRPELRLEVRKCRPEDRVIFKKQTAAGSSGAAAAGAGAGAPGEGGGGATAVDRSTAMVNEVARDFMRDILDDASRQLGGGDDGTDGIGADGAKFTVTIIYCVRREVVKDVVALVKAAYPSLLDRVVSYIGGGESGGNGNGFEQERERRRWTNGTARVMVANAAFGEAIDNQDARFCLHWEMPTLCDDMYQNFGRVGRNEKPALSLVLYHTVGRVQLCERTCPIAVQPLNLKFDLLAPTSALHALPVGSGEG